MRDIQSAQEKLRNIDNALTIAESRVITAQEKLDVEIKARDELHNKRDIIRSQFDKLQESFCTQDVATKAEAVHRLITEIQRRCQHGFPETTEDKKDFYNLIFSDPAARFEPPSQDAACGFSGLGDGVSDRAGGYGPASGKGAVSVGPYARTRSQSG